MKINGVEYADHLKPELIATNKSFIDQLRLVIFNQELEQYFLNFGFNPRYLEIVDLCLLLPDGEALVMAMYDHIIKHISGNKVPGLIESLAKYESFKPLLIRDFEQLYTRCLTNLSSRNCERLKDFAINFATLPNGEKLLLPKMDDLLLNVYDDLTLTEIQQTDVLAMFRDKLSMTKQFHQVIPTIIKSQRNDYLKTLLNNLFVSEGVNDFTSIGEASWSNLVFKVGNKVLKIGWIRNNPACPTHYRVIEPERFEIIYDDQHTPLLYLEIQEYLPNNEVSKDDISDFYFDLSKDGLTYIDPQGKDPSNFGILSNPLPVISKYGQMVSSSFIKKPVVLIDRDCVWQKDDPSIRYFGMGD